ncbi:MAG: glycosyltransferase [Vitreoscilla sp.]
MKTKGGATPILMIWPGVPAWRIDGKLWLDRKFRDGMEASSARWPGRIRAFMEVQDMSSMPPFGAWRWGSDQASFDLQVIEPGETLTASDLADVDVLLATADDHRQLEAAALCERTGTACIYVIEYTLRTRLDMTRHSKAPAWGRAKTAVWHLCNELRVSRAIRRARGLQANGIPAWRAYRASTRSPQLFFDTRFRRDMLVTPAALDSRLAVLRQGGPIRLAFSGRLIPAKGGDALLPLALRLSQLGLPFSLDIYGSGESNEEIRAGIQEHGLTDVVRLHGPVDFDEVLMPTLKERADVFVCCHRQGDPSCTYAETLGCGVPIAGFGNESLAALVDAHDIGWSVPMGDISGLAALIVRLAANREEIASKSLAAMRFAQEHHFESVVDLRMRHCASALPAEVADSSYFNNQRSTT